ncbi:MAG: hypothetical protein JNM88_19965 [Chitinophagaceae bacterium]|nr:hypothetical protein [Chitinophagaceae bacterium]
MKQILFFIFLSVFTHQAYPQHQKRFLRFFLHQRSEMYIQSEQIRFTNEDIGLIRNEMNLSGPDSTRLLNASVQVMTKKALLGDSSFYLDMKQYEEMLKHDRLITVLMVSKPVLIEGGSLMIIKADMYCGSKCGEGLIYVYKREGKNYKLVKALQAWIS